MRKLVDDRGGNVDSLEQSRKNINGMDEDEVIQR